MLENIRKITWWLCFVYAAICIQTLSPGLDVLVVGLIILLQEEDYKGIIWLLPLFCLIQEGIGTRPFGAALIWYSVAVAFFLVGKWLFEAKNFLFIFLLSISLGCAYFIIAWLMAPLQNIPFNLEDTLDKSLVQAIFIPFAWKALVAIRPSNKEDDQEE